MWFIFLPFPYDSLVSLVTSVCISSQFTRYVKGEKCTPSMARRLIFSSLFPSLEEEQFWKIFIRIEKKFKFDLLNGSSAIFSYFFFVFWRVSAFRHFHPSSRRVSQETTSMESETHQDKRSLFGSLMTDGLQVFCFERESSKGEVCSEDVDLKCGERASFPPAFIPDHQEGNLPNLLCFLAYYVCVSFTYLSLWPHDSNDDEEGVYLTVFPARCDATFTLTSWMVWRSSSNG